MALRQPSQHRAPLRVGLVGAGMISYHHLIAWSREERARVVAICDPALANAQRRASEFNIPAVYAGLEAMLAREQLDALDIASPRDTHIALVEMAAAKGIDVLCQKPLAPTLDGGVGLAGDVAGKIRLMVHENWRFRPWYRRLKQWLDQGGAGRLLQVDMATLSSGLLPDADGRRPILERQPFMGHERRLMIAEVMIHHLDTLRWLFGPLKLVSAMTAHTVPEVAGETLAAIGLETEAGVPVMLRGALDAAGYPARTLDRLEIVGNRSSVMLDGTAIRFSGAETGEENFEFERDYQASFDNVITHFVEGLLDGVPFETDVTDNLETLRLVEESYAMAASTHVAGGEGAAVAVSPIGRDKATLDTPTLLVDLDVMETNIARIAATCREHGVQWRPHIKGQKTIDIVRREMAAGAIGVTCAKLGEAEVMAAAGIRNILIANQIVGAIKIRRLVGILPLAEPIVAVDSIANVQELGAAASAAGRRLGVVIEVDIGMKRAGVAPGAPVVALAKSITQQRGLVFRGLVGWESHAVTIADPEKKRQTVAEAIALLTASADTCRKAGVAVDIVSCGGTGTYPYCVEQPGVTEVQVGGAIFSDVYYRTKFHVDFPCALTLLTTVTSRPTPTRIVLDAGKKTLSGDAAMPQPIGLPEIASARLSAEHMIVELANPSDQPCVGDHVEVVVGYSDTTVHLHDQMIATRKGRIEAVWPIAARGRSR
jgi:D-serine deaminase-like pyridoxal phosphate-dependent protein/predicted dehydrogenase